MDEDSGIGNYASGQNSPGWTLAATFMRLCRTRGHPEARNGVRYADIVVARCEIRCPSPLRVFFAFSFFYRCRLGELVLGTGILEMVGLVRFEAPGS
jgi:hypothetical protein